MSPQLVPLTVALPLVVAALLAAAGSHLPRLLPDAVAVCCAAAVTVFCLILVVRTTDRPIVYWFGGWHPTPHGFALGIDFDVEPLAAAEAALAAVVVLAALVFAWGHFEGVRHYFHALVLVFLAGMVGFALSGDLFNIFVFLELMSVAAYALCAYRIERPEVVQGSVNFAVLNSVGTFSLLMGIALLYGRTANLNLIGIGETLAQDHPRGLLVAAFTLVTVGFLVKAGAAPFHFWLSDAYAVANAPTAAIFTAAMSELALNVYSRVHATAFAGSLHPESAVRAALLALAVLGAVVGAGMCFLQADLKRQVAFLTVSNGGVVLAGFALADAPGTAGSVLFLVTAGLLRGALMLGLGILVVRLGSTDELALHGRGRGHPALGLLLAVCALGLAAPPGFGPFLSLSLVDDGLAHAGYEWIAVLLTVCLAVGAGTVLRAVARVFLGWGAAQDPALTSQPMHREKESTDEDDADPDHRHHDRLRALAATVPLAVVSYGLAFVPHLAPQALKAAQDLLDHAAQAALVLHGTPPPHRALPGYAVRQSGWIYGAASTGGALVVAAAGLWWRRAPTWTTQAFGLLRRPVDALKAVHNGSVGDYATWLVSTTAVLAVGWAATLH